ncbi:MAG TPA: hypothetical protein VK830_05060 [Xanthomonadales bacterium]|nr:hypothetical protein [Xanthomonadales bacterium]
MFNTLLKCISAGLLLVSAAVPAQLAEPSCPTGLEALTNWFETTPALTGVSEVRMQLTFQNDTGSELSFSANPEDTLQIWTTPSLLTPAPLVFDSAPSGAVAAGATFSYDLTAGILPTEDGFGIRPVDNNLFGTLAPDQVSVVSAQFQCEAAAGPTSIPVPAMSVWALFTLMTLLLVVSARRLALRK